MDNELTAYIMMGPSGGGKSTWVDNNCTSRAIVCSADNYFIDGFGQYSFDPEKLSAAHSYCLWLFIETLQDQTYDVVCDNTNTTVAEIVPYIAAAEAYGYKVRVIYCLPEDAVWWTAHPHDVLAERNRHGVPSAVIGAQINRLQRLLAAWLPWWPKVEYVESPAAPGSGA